MTDPIERILKDICRPNKNADVINKYNCLDEETLADYFEGRLVASQVETVEEHLAGCSSCRRSVIVIMKVSQEGAVDFAHKIGGISKKWALDPSENMKAQLEEELSRFEEKLGLKPLVSSPQESACIMIVDDDSHYLSSLTDILSQEFSVIACKSGQEAIAKIDHQVRTIVLDIRMPAMNGLDLAKYFKNKGLKIPIIFNTAYPGDYPKSLIVSEIPSAMYVTKDDPDKLISCLQQVTATA